MDPRHDFRALRDAKKAARIEKRQGENLLRYGHMLEDFTGLACAVSLETDSPAVKDDLFMRLVRQHIEHGFPLSPAIEEKLKDRFDRAVFSEAEDIDWILCELLKISVGGLSAWSRKRAYSMIDGLDRNGAWSEHERLSVQGLLWEARNGARR